MDIADYAEEVWEELGFKVEVADERTNIYQDALYKGEFDVIGLDYQGLTTDAFSYLAPFAREYSGSVIEIGEDTDTTKPHITGFDNAEYNALIDEIFNTVGNNSKRVDLLHKAEEMLIDEAPAIPLTFNVINYMRANSLEGISSSIFGYRDFCYAELDDYNDVKARLETYDVKARVQEVREKNAK